MRWLCSVRNALSVVFVGLGVCSATAAETSLQGWGAYRFGMTPDQVRTLPGRSWSKLETVTGIYIMRAVETIKLDGHDFQILVGFNKSKVLYSISLTEAGTARPFSECERAYQDLLRNNERRFGLFSPDQQPGKTQLRGDMKWRSLPGGSSNYFVFTAGPVGSFVADTKRRFGRAWVAVHIEGDNSGRCEFSLNFQQD